MTVFQIPALRDDLDLRASEGGRFPWVLEDPVLRIRLPLDDFGHVLVQQLVQPVAAKELFATLVSFSTTTIAPSLLYRYIHKLKSLGFFEGCRAVHNRQSIECGVRDEQVDIKSLPMAFVAGLQHACQACGSCCSSTDVGPIDPLQATRIRAHDWTEIIDGLDENESVFRSGQIDGQSILMTQMRNDQCIFLSEDKLCLVHRHLGVDAKPTQCRQFPYVFSVCGDRIDVSLSMECRAYWKAKKSGTPPADQQEMLRELIELGAPVHRIGTSILLDSATLLARSDYLDLEHRLVKVVEETVYSSPHAAIIAMLQSADEAFATIFEPIEQEESQWVDPDRWASALSTPQASLVTGEIANSLLLTDIVREFVTFCEQARAIACDRELSGLSMRFSFLENTARGVLGDISLESFGWADTDASNEIVRDLLVSGLFSKVAPRSKTVKFGVGVLAFRAYLTVIGACFRARQACRVNVSVQDLIDSMVTLSKMLREEAVIEFLGRYENTLFSAMVAELVHSPEDV